MARPPKGKPLTMRTMRLDDDVWAECQRLGKEHGTINEGLRSVLLITVTGNTIQVTVPPPQPGDKVLVRSLKGPLLRPKDKKK